MSRLVINGGVPISGTHRVPGNKNAALPMLAAALLTSEPVAITNLPLIQDVRTMLELLSDLGAEVSLNQTAHSVRICARRVRSARLNQALCKRVRSSILFAGPLLGRCGRATLPPPGGDVIGRRRLDTHFDGFKALGAEVHANGQFALRAAKGLSGRQFLLDEASVTATENLIMAAVLAKGETILYNTACEPHVQDLCRMLNAMGAKISGIGTNRLTIGGVEELHGTEHRVGPDFMDAGSYISAALVTGGILDLEDIEPDDFEVIGKPFRRLGARWTIDRENRRLHVPGKQKLKVSDDLGGAIPTIADGPWPMFPSDLMSVLIVLATQTSGTTLFFEKMFESRMFFVDHLIGMGAHIVQCDPHRVVVSGKATLFGSRVASPDIRAGMALLVAALCAKRETEILNAGSIDRGYESVEHELRRLGARIERMDD